MKSLQGLIMALLWASFCSVSSISIGEDGGYRNIVVKIDDTVPEDYCYTYLQNLKEMLTEGSAVLSEALGGRVYLAQVTLVIPSYWRDARCHIAVPYPTAGVKYQVPDILITPDSPVFGSSLHTQQSRGCGERGDRILIPQSFLANWNETQHTWGNPGKLFVKEWSKLRYGVYDEHGFPNDPLYPNYFKYQDRILPTGSSNVEVRGVWLYPNGTGGCEPTSGGCYYDPMGENEEASCSLGYMPFLSRVKSWCEHTEFTPMSPTKHNILCSGKSSLEVINENSDFAVLGGENQLQKSLIPRFDIVREPLPKYVLLMETSAAMADVWKWVRKATQNLIRYVVPDNSNLAVVTFTSDARVEHRMVQLTTESVRSRMADSIPDSPNKLDQSTEGCVSCGVQIALEQVLKNQEAGAHLIIISKEENNIQAALQEQNILAEVEKYSVRVSSIVLAGALENGNYLALAASTGGVHRRISGRGDTLDMYSDFIEAMRDVVAVDNKDPANHALTVYRQFFRRQDSEPTVGAFDIDASLGRQTEFGIYVEDDEDHQIKSVEFTDSQGNVYGPFTKMSSTYDVVNFKTINFNVGEEPPFDAKRGTTWQYKIEWYDINENRENVVTVRSKPSQVGEVGLIKVETWTNMMDTDSVNEKKLLAIFVKVTRGDSPVVKAGVRVDLQVDTGNEDPEPVQLSSLTLMDDGYGEPDLVAGDGIYSRYLTKYPGAGKYKYKVYVDDNNGLAASVSPGLATVNKPPKVGISTCCGSVLPVPVDRLERIGLFHRQTEGPAVTLSQIQLDGDRIRPGKIGDLEITVLAEKQQLLARWTAPGGDFYDGELMTYRFVFSQKIEELITPSTNAPALDGLKRSDAAGKSVSKVINFKYYGADYYVGLYAFDEAGNKGTMSNIVLVNVPPPPTTTHESGTTEPIVLQEQTNWTMIGAIIGAVSVLLIILLVGLYCHFCRTRARFNKSRFANHLKSNGVKVQIPSPPESEKTDSSSYESESKGASNNLVSGLAYPKVSSTSFANNITPTYWSASQLLSEHEIRKREQEQGGPRHEEYPDVINYDPSNYNPAGEYAYYQEQYNYNDQYYDQYNTRHRFSTSSSTDPGYQVYNHYKPDYGVRPDYDVLEPGRRGDYTLDPVLNKSSQRLVNSDLSSSTLGITNPSLLGSQLSLGSMRNSQNKNRNITQV